MAMYTAPGNEPAAYSEATEAAMVYAAPVSAAAASSETAAYTNVALDGTMPSMDGPPPLVAAADAVRHHSAARSTGRRRGARASAAATAQAGAPVYENVSNA